MVVVGAHQQLDLPPLLVARRSEALRDDLLHAVVEDVDVVFALHVDDGADAQHEVLGLVQASDVGVRLSRGAAGHAGQEPDGGRVTQPPGGVLDVRLELEHGVVELPVALPRQIDQRRPHRSAPG